MLKYILLAALILFVLIIGVFYIALAPTIRNQSGIPAFKQWIGKPLILQHPGLVYIHPKGNYSFYPQVLTERRNGGYQLAYELPAGTVITIRSFKTYKNNAGSGSTSLYALGDFLTTDGKKVPFEYDWTYRKSIFGDIDMEKLPPAIWQKTGETQVDNDF
ncbi:hypothetical protein SAMN05518672_101819 [Chitinophaga sp. CF118]|uniref:hypothetical protein n=1 Tax=Chitinophaga sp. CF118 TaxID=1884367 RepID=UPI0008F1FF43|nr:hypothetical protein [Chitinophaga sp. CF118]SFD16240.1 hypothetical protein SAMN05518672_101819 [Chitinophaga sp. CF118]